MLSPLLVTLDQAQRILDHHRNESMPISSFEEVKGSGYSAFTPTTTYEVVLSDTSAYLLKVARAPSNLAGIYAPNTLAVEHTFLQQLAQYTSIPQPTPHALDTSLALLPHHYLLLSRPRGLPLSHVRARGLLSERQALMLQLRMGAYLKQLHGVQNDWFGLPAQAGDALYSWQEAFTGLLEDLLEEAHMRGVDAPYADVRGFLSRAIGFFLFDDCEVPSLVSFTGDEDAVLLDIDPDAPAQADEVVITSFLSFSHALWGDPLLETLFLNPSAALVEGYGGPLVLFARQKTKRIWYTLFLAVAVLVQAKREEMADEDKRVVWARETLAKCIEDLKDAPCY
ncbi:hypothetical protein SCP_0601750 [Sparassis crispa]|uniref:Aminoglycoside phosphotransferase domain-containing protein n=1 Tax=Sparassis crispa TaxID=139825 RepID=A0A401GPP8_9APHY|nr:hypothetical protein SCP_0601750 [Sparassis crispa]GBE84197.1 hypothetical protein SCP_0601750 [Sparassis crispa]